MNYKKTKEYVITEMKKMLSPDFQIVQGYKFSSKDLAKEEVVDALLKATDMILFPDGKYLFRFMLDRYKVIGATEMLDIIRHFVNWTDTENRF